MYTVIGLFAPFATGLALVFPVFALTTYQLPGGHPDNPLSAPLDIEQGSWFGQRICGFHDVPSAASASADHAAMMMMQMRDLILPRSDAISHSITLAESGGTTTKVDWPALVSIDVAAVVVVFVLFQAVC
jgi:hypothetical protein